MAATNAPARESALSFSVRAHRPLVVGVILVAVAGCAWFGWHAWQKHEAAVKTANKPPPSVPVTVAEVRKGDFPVYLNGLGTVQPFDTVPVRSRVDGEVIKVGFKQGQMVKQGDMLAEIDPRPYQAALDQANAKKTQDEASLRNAQLNLERFTTLAKQDFATRQQLDTQQATVEQLTAQIQGDQGVIDNAQDAARLHDHPLAARRPRGLPHGRPRQHRPRGRHHRHRLYRPHAADLGRAHGA